MTKASGAIEQRRRAILTHETGLARALALELLERPALSAWMILIPFLLLYYMQRQQAFKDAYAEISEALLRSSRRALDLACAHVCGESAQREPVCCDNAQTIRELRAAQDSEVMLLAQHYEKLLSAEGEDYRALARHAYGDASDYREMLERLQAVESAVNAVARRISAEAGRAELFERLERVRSEARSREVELIFG